MMIEALLEIRELAAIKTVEAGVEPDNVRALRCLEGSGFVAESNGPIGRECCASCWCVEAFEEESQRAVWLIVSSG